MSPLAPNLTKLWLPQAASGSSQSHLSTAGLLPCMVGLMKSGWRLKSPPPPIPRTHTHTLTRDFCHRAVTLSSSQISIISRFLRTCWSLGSNWRRYTKIGRDLWLFSLYQLTKPHPLYLLRHHLLPKRPESTKNINIRRFHWGVWTTTDDGSKKVWLWQQPDAKNTGFEFAFPHCFCRIYDR